MTAVKDKRISYEDMYDRLLDVTEEFSLQGANPFHVANVMSRVAKSVNFLKLLALSVSYTGKQKRSKMMLKITRCNNCNEPAAAKDGSRFLCSDCWFNVWAPREVLHGSKERNFGNVERHGLANSRPKHQSGGKLVRFPYCI
mgnify:CR=1 FL=1